MIDKDQRHVESALHHLDVLKSYLEQGTMDDPVLFDAVWKAIWSTRNRIAHAYEYIDPQLIRSTVESDLVHYEDALRGLLPQGPAE